MPSPYLERPAYGVRLAPSMPIHWLHQAELMARHRAQVVEKGVRWTASPVLDNKSDTLPRILPVVAWLRLRRPDDALPAQLPNLGSV